MTKEDKELLLRDLSARLCYGVIVNYKEDKYDFHKWKISTLHAPAYSRSGNLINTDSDGWIEYNEYKGCGMSAGSRPLYIETTLPFLRPMSSMTEEEKNELNNYIFSEKGLRYFWFDDGIMYSGPDNQCFIGLGNDTIDRMIDWLNAHHFDYRRLIEKGLALEAPNGMYNLEKK